MASIDVLCVGQASYDLVFSVSRHPGPDEKSAASLFAGCGGGPAANAAVTAARLGRRAAFAGYLGNDVYGRIHQEELARDNVRTDFVYRGSVQTPLSAILVKPDGKRTVVNYKDPAIPPPADPAAFLFDCRPKVILFDGHEPHLAPIFMAHAKKGGIPTVLDAGSVHAGTRELVGAVDYLVASEKFSRDFTGEKEVVRAAQKLHHYAPAVVVTRGEAGLVWQTAEGAGQLEAFAVEAIDTTGAGDAFHGAFCAGLSEKMDWLDLLRYSSAAAALACTGYGARPAIPDADAVDRFLKTVNK
ncbi:MAG: PfkB family carbohydrate kinase [Desulfobacterales bacterium]|nr:PfkB family carbohydrate kinase [Desulfobacterales bacterium]